MTQTEAAWPKGVSQPAIRALTAAGYFQLDELSGASESALLKLHGMGPKSIRVIKGALTQRGLPQLTP